MTHCKVQRGTAWRRAELHFQLATETHRWLVHLCVFQSIKAPQLWDEGVTICLQAVCKCLVAQSCLTPCDPMDCSPPGSPVHGDSPGKNTGVGCHAVLQSFFPTQGSNPGLLHCSQIVYYLNHQGRHRITEGKMPVRCLVSGTQKQSIIGTVLKLRVLNVFSNIWMNILEVGKDPKTLPGPVSVPERKLLHFSKKRKNFHSLYEILSSLGLPLTTWTQSPPPTSMTSISTFHRNDSLLPAPPRRPPASHPQVFPHLIPFIHLCSPPLLFHAHFTWKLRFQLFWKFLSLSLPDHAGRCPCQWLFLSPPLTAWLHLAINSWWAGTRC